MGGGSGGGGRGGRSRGGGGGILSDPYKSNSISEATTYADRLGVKVITDASTDVSSMNNVNAWLQSRKLEGQPIPKEVDFRFGNQDKFMFPTGHIYASATPVLDHININKNHDLWKGSNYQKQTSVLNHEMGHILHYTNNKTNYDKMGNIPKSKMDMIRKEVGSYATINKREFVAEVYEGMNNGKTYSTPVMKYYGSLKGPKV